MHISSDDALPLEITASPCLYTFLHIIRFEREKWKFFDKTSKIEATDMCFNDVINCNKRPLLPYKVCTLGLYDSGWIPGDQMTVL